MAVKSVFALYREKRLRDRESRRAEERIEYAERVDGWIAVSVRDAPGLFGGDTFPAKESRESEWVAKKIKSGKQITEGDFKS